MVRYVLNTALCGSETLDIKKIGAEVFGELRNEEENGGDKMAGESKY